MIDTDFGNHLLQNLVNYVLVLRIDENGSLRL